MVATGAKFSLSQLTENIKIDLEFARENVKLAQDVDYFQGQKDFWEGKVEALEHVVVALEKTSALIVSLESKKENFMSRVKSMLVE